MRSWMLAGATVLIVMPTVLAFFSGGYFDEPRLVAAIVSWGLVVAVGALAARPLPVSAAGRAALLGLALLCAWTGLSLSWAPAGGQAQDDFQRLLLYLGFFIASLGLLRVAEVRRLLEPALALGAFAVIGYALSERLLPGVFELERSASAAGRLEQPLTYWNAAGIVATMGFLLATRVAGDRERPIALRAGLAAAAVPLGLGIYLTFARGALAALVVGLLVLVAFAPDARAQLRSAVLLVLASAFAALVANGLPTVKSLGERDSGDGLLMLAVLLTLGLGAAYFVPRRPQHPFPLPSLPRSRPAVVVGVAIVLAVAGGLAVAAFEGKPEAGTPVTGADPGRLGSIETNRYSYWEAALDTFADHPLRGVGAGGFAVEWLKRPDRPDAARDAHSLPIETAAELGLIGLAFLLLFAGGVAVAAVRLLRSDPRIAAGPVATLAAWALHACLDWDWEVPAVSLIALLVAAAVIAWSEELPAPA